MTLVRALRLVFAALALVAVVAAAPISRADAPPADAPVKLERLPPFDKWCVAPVCAGEPQQKPSLLKLPPALQPNASDGFIEASLKSALARELEKGVQAALGPAYNEAVADVAEAIAAMTASDPKALENLGGLGAAVLRAALVYHVDGIVPQDPACLPPRRFDAIYEGLAISVALAPLQFSKKKGSVPAPCVATARATANVVDEAVLDALVPDEVKRQVVDIAKQVQATRSACAQISGASQAALDRVKNAEEAIRAKTVAATAQALKRLKARMYRGSLLAGVRYGSPVDRVSLQFLAGGGGQYEDPDTTRFESGNTYSLNSQANFTGQANGRLLLRVHVVPQIFGVRLRADSTYFAITREALTAAVMNGAVTTTTAVEQQQQIDVHGRLFLDAEIAAFAGFVPALFGGLDYIGISGSTTSTSTAIPSLGAGIVRTAW